MMTSDVPTPPRRAPRPPVASSPAGSLGWADSEHAAQLLRYTPDGLLGGTFTCTRCGAQAWQPDLLPHAEACPYRAPDGERPAGAGGAGS